MVIFRTTIQIPFLETTNLGSLFVITKPVNNLNNFYREKQKNIFLKFHFFRLRLTIFG